MADAPALGAGGSNPMEVQVLSPAPSGFALWGYAEMPAEMKAKTDATAKSSDEAGQP